MRRKNLRVLIIISGHTNGDAEKVGTSGDSNVVTSEEKKEPGGNEFFAFTSEILFYGYYLLSTCCLYTASETGMNGRN